MSAISDSARYSFGGKTILVTGGAGHIGKVTAHRFARDGANVALLDIDAAKLEAARAEFAAYPGEATALRCDVTDLAAVQAAVARVAAHYGRLHYLFNNAGYQGRFAPADRYPAEDFERVIAINVTGVFHVLKVVAGHMRGAGGGAIVNTASHAGVAGPPNMLAYAASKFAVVGMTQTAAKDLAPHGIRVNAVSPALIGPGFMWTRQTELQAQAASPYFDADPKLVEAQMLRSVPLRRLGSTEEVANAVAFLMSDEASYVTGFNLEVTGGL